MDRSTGTFSYMDKHFGDTEGVIVETNNMVFHPTSTSNLLLAGVRKSITPGITSALDLGCGCGIVAVVLAKLVLPKMRIYASDISEEAVRLATRNAEKHKLNIDCRTGSLFEPWTGKKFDLIVDDVAGIAEPIARLSNWYPEQIHSEAGEDGTRWIVNILSQAREYLTERGQIFFPALTLSNETKIIKTAKENFTQVEPVTEQWYPLSNELLKHHNLIEDLMNRNIIEIKQKGSRWLWATKIYRAYNS